VIEEVKQRVPIWKRETYVDGTVEWVNAAAQPEQYGPAVLIDCVEELAQWTLIDVREDDEREEDPIVGFAHLVSPKKSFDRRLLENRQPLLVCARGVSALLLADDLRREGFTDVWSLTGGHNTLKQIAKKTK
jgi:rhodanese-related sulfurtransferase